MFANSLAEYSLRDFKGFPRVSAFGLTICFTCLPDLNSLWLSFLFKVPNECRCLVGVKDLLLAEREREAAGI